MYTTNNDVRTATITIKIRPTGEYGNRRKVTITLPAEFDINDKASKVTITLPAEFDINDKASTEVYYHAWNEHRGLPADHPYRTAIESVKDKAVGGIRLHELMLTSCKGVTSVSIAPRRLSESSLRFSGITSNTTLFPLSKS